MTCLVVCGLVLLSCWGIGAGLDRLLVRGLGRGVLPTLSGAEPSSGPALCWRLVLGTGLGMGLAGTLIMPVGLVGFPPRIAWWAGTLVFALVGLVLLPWRAWRGLVPRGWVPWAGVLASFGLLILHVVMTLIPELEVDEAVYHLTVPKAWLLAGRIFPVNFEPHSDFHYHSQMISLWSMALVPDDYCAARLLELARTVLAVVGMGALVGARTKPAVGWIVGFVLLANEDVARWATTAQIDAGQSLYAVLGVGMLGQWLETPERRVPGALGSFFLGLVVAVKNVGWFLAGAGLMSSLMVWAVVCRGRAPLAPLVLVATIWLVPVLPWMAKSTVYTGNPIYPFATTLMPVNERAAPGYYWLAQFYKPDTRPIWEKAIPSAGQVAVVRSNASVSSSLGSLYYAPLAVLFWVLGWRRMVASRRASLGYMAMVSMMTVPVMLHTPFPRFFIAVFPLAVGAAVIGAWGLCRTEAQKRLVVAGGLALAFLAGWRALDVHQYTQVKERRIESWQVPPPLTDAARAEWFRQRDTIGTELLELAERLPDGALPLVSVATPSTPRLRRPFLPNVPCVGQEAVFSLTHQGWDAERTVRILREYGVTHLLTLARYEEGEEARFREKYLVLEAEGSRHGIRLYRLVPIEH